jgi:hypothetical protein
MRCNDCTRHKTQTIPRTIPALKGRCMKHAAARYRSTQLVPSHAAHRGSRAPAYRVPTCLPPSPSSHYLWHPEHRSLSTPYLPHTITCTAPTPRSGALRLSKDDARDTLLRGVEAPDASPALLRTEGAGLPPLLLRLLPDAAAASRSRFCRTYSVGSKRCLGGALLGRGGREGLESGKEREAGRHVSIHFSLHIPTYFELQSYTCNSSVGCMTKCTRSQPKPSTDRAIDSREQQLPRYSLCAHGRV